MNHGINGQKVGRNVVFMTVMFSKPPRDSIYLKLFWYVEVFSTLTLLVIYKTMDFFSKFCISLRQFD